MTASKILGIILVVGIIAFGQYQKSQVKVLVTDVPAKPIKEIAQPQVRTTIAPKAIDLPTPEPQVVEQSNNNMPVIDKAVETKPTPTVVVQNSPSNNVPAKTQVYSQKMIVTNEVLPFPRVTKELPNLELFLPERSNLTKEEKIAEIRSLTSIFREHLTKIYQDKQIDYISKDHDRVSIMTDDCIEFYEDPIAFEQKSTPSFIKSTMEFLEDVQKLRREAHQRYLSKHKL